MSTAYERHILKNRIPVGDSYLTQREYQVVALYMDGIRHDQMPAMLACGLKTIDSHLRVARERIGARTIHELIAKVATADAFRGIGRSSNRVDCSTPVGAARDRVDAVTGNYIGPGAAPSRAL